MYFCWYFSLFEWKSWKSIISQMCCNKNHCSFSALVTGTCLTVVENDFSQLVFSKAGAWKVHSLCSATKGDNPGNCSSWICATSILEGRWESWKWQRVTSAECELPANVYNWNMASGIVVTSRCSIMADLQRVLHFGSLICFLGAKTVTLSLTYHKLPCSNTVNQLSVVVNT